MIPFKKEWTPLRRMMLAQAAGGAVALEDVEVSGNPCVFSTDLARPLPRLALSLLPRQSGTGDPSPSNICPLLPWGEVGTWTGGRNICRNEATFPQTLYGYLFTKNEDGSISVERVSSANSNAVVYLAKGTKEHPVVPTGGTYTWRGFPQNSDFTSTNTTLQLTLTSKATGEVYQRRQLRIDRLEDTFTVPDSAYVSDIFIRIDKSETASATFKPQLVVGEVEYPFVPPTITPHPVNLQANLLPPLTSETKNGVTISVANDGTVKVNGTPTEDTYFDCSFSYFVAEGEKMNICGFNPVASSSSRATIFLITDKGNPQVNLHTANAITTQSASADTTISKYRLRLPKDVTFTNFVIKPLLYIGENAPTEYQPYLPPVYGCELDLTTGEVWGTYLFDELTGADIDTYGTASTGVEYVRCITPSGVEFGSSTVCDAYTYSVAVPLGSGYFRHFAQGAIYFYDSRFTSLEVAKELLNANPVHVCYKLATPVLLATLTPQQVSALVGVNTVWSDADGIELTFTRKKVRG